MANCNGITIGSDYDCLNPLKAKVNERLLVGNLDDIATITYDVTNPSLITDITMKTGKSMFAFQGVRSTVKPQVDLVASEVTVGFSHQVDFSIFEVDSAQKENLQGMSAKSQFAIYQNPKDSSLGDAVWEVMGINSGLEVAVLTRLPADGATGGAYTVQLKTPEAASETSLPNSFFDTDITTTEALIAGLVSGDNLTLTTGTVEVADASDIILTFDKTITAFGTITIGGAGSVGKTVLSVVILTNVVTITVSAPYVAAEVISVSGGFDAADGTLNLSNEPITNNLV